ncbi:hypothetical protein DFH09DRAFT_1169617 [Mycena vulgaris]|nr:hypothetical protein DFH09DRAFT_1169617 [Mycena vulgaris]
MSNHPVILEEQTAPPSVPVVPIEIQFLILDRVYIGKQKRLDLQRLTSICRVWAGYIQSLLFRKICLGQSDAERFLSLVRQRRHLGDFVTTLEIWADIDLEELPHLFPNVRNVTLVTRTSGPTPESRFQWPAVTRLRLILCSFSTAQDVWDFIGLFPSRKRLGVSGWDYAVDWMGSNITVDAPALELDYLSIRPDSIFDTQPVVRCLAMGDINVHSLSIELSAADASACNSLLLKVCHALHDLEVFELPSKEHLEREPLVAICISPCTRLRHLTLGLRHSILETICFRVSRTARHLHLQWCEIDGALNGRGFDNLQRVVFEVNEWVPPGGRQLITFKQFVDRMDDFMIGIRQSGRLHFESISRELKELHFVDRW